MKIAIEYRFYLLHLKILMIRQGQKKKTKDLKKALRFIVKFQDHPQKKGVGQMVSWSVYFSNHLHLYSPPKKPTIGRVS